MDDSVALLAQLVLYFHFDLLILLQDSSMRTRSHHRIVWLWLLHGLVFRFLLCWLYRFHLRIRVQVCPWLSIVSPPSYWQTSTSRHLPSRHPSSSDRNNFDLSLRLLFSFSFVLCLILQHLFLVGQYEVAHLRWSRCLLWLYHRRVPA